MEKMDINVFHDSLLKEKAGRVAQVDQRPPEQQREVCVSASDSFEAAVLGHRLPVRPPWQRKTRNGS